jgi:hypothetical protein
MPEAAPNPFSALTGAPPPPPPAPAAVPARPAPLAQSTPAEGPAQERWLFQQREITKSDPFRDPSVKITRDPVTGAVTAEARSPDPANPQHDQPPVGNASVEGGRLKVGDVELSPEDVAGLMERRALEQSRAALVPKTPGEYTLPDMQSPAGAAEFRWAVDDPTIGPLLGAAKNWAHETGLTNEQFQSAMKVYAGSLMNERRLIDEAAQRQRGLLGELAPVRIQAVTQFLRGHLGDEAARALTSNMVLASQVVAFEKLAHRFASGGVAGSFNGAHREPSLPGKVSDETYANMSYAERIEYASRFPQQPGGR